MLLGGTSDPRRCAKKFGGTCKAICDGTNEILIPKAGCRHGHCCVCVGMYHFFLNFLEPGNQCADNTVI
jgi:hypothetical protein